MLLTAVEIFIKIMKISKSKIRYNVILNKSSKKLIHLNNNNKDKNYKN